MPFMGLGMQENTYSASSHICLNCKVRSKTKCSDFQTHLSSHTKNNNPEIANHAPGKKADHVQSCFSLYTCKKLHEVLMWMRNTGSLYMGKGSYSRAWVYALVLPLASRWLQRTPLTWTSQKQTMTWGWTEQCAFSVSCLRKWTLSHKY